MLRELHIKNFSIIDEISLEFDKGFTVLTGETGAGKSIIINALSLTLGERASSEVVRTGEKETAVESLFDISRSVLGAESRKFLDDNEIDIEHGIIMKRIVTGQGRSKAYINGSIVNMQTISEVSRGMIDVHGQYDHQSLLSPDNQLDVIDNFGGLTGDREKVGKLYGALYSVKRQISNLNQREKERAQHLDMLEFQVNEIESANLVPGEEESLSNELKVLESAVQLAERANNAYEKLYSSDSACLTNLAQILDDLREIANIDSKACDAMKSIEDAIPMVEETGYFLRDYKDSLEFEPSRLDQLQERLETIKRLKSKYGDNITEVLEFLEKAKNELADLLNAEEKMTELNDELENIRKKLSLKANALSVKRKSVAKRIESEVMKQLAELSMPDTAVSIHFSHDEGDDTTDGLRSTSTGIDCCEVLISPNRGEDLKPLSKVVSGGELSRIMLSLKSTMAKGDRIPVLIFDEIDSGIGGKTAERVGQKLKKLSSNHQIICITHLPQIASYADSHLKIEKKIEKGRTVVRISEVKRDERVAEVARMLGGDVSEVSIRHAEEMLNKVGK